MVRELRVLIMTVAACCVSTQSHGKAASTPVVSPGDFQRDVLAELNKARRDPSQYAKLLRAYRGYFSNNLVSVPGSAFDIITEEGVAPVDEAIQFLDAQASRNTLDPSSPLADAASDHCAEQARDGAVGHHGRDGSGPGDRVARRGGGTYVGEVIAYGSTDAIDVIRQLIVDDGVPDRGHRELLFASDVRFAGVSCGPHPTYRTMCVIDFARTNDGRSLAESAKPGRRPVGIAMAMR